MSSTVLLKLSCACESPGNVVEIQILIQPVWATTREAPLLAFLQVIRMLLVCKPHLEYQGFSREPEDQERALRAR